MLIDDNAVVQTELFKGLRGLDGFMGAQVRLEFNVNETGGSVNENTTS